MMVYPIVPVPAPRQVNSDKWRPTARVLRYRAFRDEVRLRKVCIPESGFHVVFTLPMPQSWSQKKKREMDGRPHKQKPDVDNLVKALLDAIYGDDSHVWDGRMTKVWGQQGQIAISDICCPLK